MIFTEEELIKQARGRPKKDEANKLSVEISFRLNQKDAEALKEVCVATGTSVREFFRGYIIKRHYDIFTHVFDEYEIFGNYGEDEEEEN